jgi:hypothetical protein
MSEGSGDCFEVALMLGSSLHREAPSYVTVYIVHGRPLGQGPENRGKRYWHGWIELDVLHEPSGTIMTQVIDYSNGHEFKMPKEMYYAIGKITPELAWRFTVEEGLKHALELEKHFGPWVEGWENYAL